MFRSPAKTAHGDGNEEPQQERAIRGSRMRESVREIIRSPAGSFIVPCRHHCSECTVESRRYASRLPLANNELTNYQDSFKMES